MNPRAYCQQKVRLADTGFYLGLFLLPAEIRRSLIALYAFSAEVGEIRHECSDATIAARKLDWWRDEIGKVYAGRPAHPVAHELVFPVTHCACAAADFTGIIDGVERNLATIRIAGEAQLREHCADLTYAFHKLLASVLGANNRRSADYLRELGIASRMTEIICEAGRDARRGHIYIPADDLSRAGVSETDILESSENRKINTLMTQQAERARSQLALAVSLVPSDDRFRIRPLLARAAVDYATLDELQRQGYPVLKQRTMLTPARKLWITWRTYRREKKRYNRIRHA